MEIIRFPGILKETIKHIWKHILKIDIQEYNYNVQIISLTENKILATNNIPQF